MSSNNAKCYEDNKAGSYDGEHLSEGWLHQNGEVFFEEVAFELRSYKKKGARHARMWRKSLLGKGNALVAKAFEK